VPHRLVTDDAGSTWQVWSVVPDTSAARPTLAVLPQYARGWLAFEQMTGAGAIGSALDERRRLAPVPAEWDGAPDAALVTLLEAAVPVRARRIDAGPHD
jgi:hypothetical protein